MPVLLPSWVESCWEEGLQKVVYATDPEMVSQSTTGLKQASLNFCFSSSPSSSGPPLLLSSFSPFLLLLFYSLPLPSFLSCRYTIVRHFLAAQSQ